MPPLTAIFSPFSQLGIDLGEAHIIRNAGGVAYVRHFFITAQNSVRFSRDALRSLIISQRLLGTREIAVYHHTGCGLVTMTTPGLQKLVKDADPTNTEAGKQIDAIDFLEYGPDLEKSVRDDVQFLKDSPLILKDTKITGWIWDVETEKVSQKDLLQLTQLSYSAGVPSRLDSSLAGGHVSIYSITENECLMRNHHVPQLRHHSP